VHSLSIGFRRLDCSTGQYALFSLFYKKGVDGFYPSTPNIIEPLNGRWYFYHGRFLFYPVGDVVG
ncbi:hypothetical protein ACRPNP_05640, partial [Levilactobacillus brevis]